MSINNLIEKSTKAYQAGKYRQAKDFCQKIIKKQPQSPVGYKLLATNHIKLFEYDLAEKAIDKVLALGERSEAIYHLQATVWIEQGKLAQAQSQFEQLFNQTGNPSLLLDIGLTHHRLGDAHSAKHIYQELLKHQPEHAKCQYNIALLNLYFREFESAWPGFEYRHQLSEQSQPKLAPDYQLGQSLTNKKVIVLPEQGIADQIIFASCIPELAAVASEVVIICETRLKTLFQHNFANCQVITDKDLKSCPELVSGFDIQIALGTLPSLFRQKESDFTGFVYQATSSAISAVNQQLDASKLNVGISWYGGQKVNSEKNRWSSKLPDWSKLLKLPNINWYNLQYGEYKSELNANRDLTKSLISLPEHSAKDDFDKYGALISQLDLVISVDNAAAIFSSFLGKATWVMAPTDPFWAWTIEGENSPWFPNSQCITKNQQQSWQEFLDLIYPQLIAVRDAKLS